MRQTSQKQKKNTCIENGNILFLKKKGVCLFSPNGVTCLYMRLKPGHKTPKPPG